MKDDIELNLSDIEQYLSDIETQWTLLDCAHNGAEAEAAAARDQLMRRYGGAVYRYLRKAVRDSSVAEDLFQDFALRFTQGRFGQVDREQGRFRNYVKGALFRLVQDHYRAQGKSPRLVSLDQDLGIAAPDEEAAADQAFRDSWRQEPLDRAWKALERVQAKTAQPFHDVLRSRVDQPDLSSEQLAEQLSQRQSKTYTAAGVRQLLHRARECFAKLLLADIRQSLAGGPQARVEEELAELNLLKYCKDVLDRRRGS